MSAIIDSLSINDRISMSGNLPPREAIMDIAPPSMPSSSKIVSVVPISSSTCGPSQTIQFQLPSRNAMRNGSAYLRFKCDFEGATHPFSFAGASASAQALFNSVQLQINGVVCEQINNYHHWNNNVVQAHCMTAESLTNTAMCEGSYTTQNFSAGSYNAVNTTGANLLTVANTQFPAGNSSHFFTVDLSLGLFHNKNATMLPLFLLNNALLTIQTNPLTKCLHGSNASFGITSYTISNLEFVFEEIVLSEEYLQSVRSGLSQNKLIKIEAESCLNVQISGAPTVQQLFSLNLSSLDAIAWGVQLGADSLIDPKVFQATYTTSPAYANELNDSSVRYEVYKDGENIYNSSRQLCDPQVAYRELKRALAGTVSSTENTPIVQQIGVPRGGLYFGSYSNSAYLRALSTRRWIDEGTSMNGSKCNTVRIQFQNPYLTSNDSIQMFFIHSYVLLLDGAGGVSKVM